MRLCDALEEKQLDVRIRDRLIAEGKITSEEVDKYLKSLEDDSDKVETTEGQSLLRCMPFFHHLNLKFIKFIKPYSNEDKKYHAYGED